MTAANDTKNDIRVEQYVAENPNLPWNRAATHPTDTNQAVSAADESEA